MDEDNFMQKNGIILGVMFFMSLLLTGCFGSSPPELKAYLQTGNFLNPNIYNAPSPVVVSFYQLKSPTIFQQSNFFNLYNNPEKTLDSDLLDKYEVEIRPGTTQSINFNLLPNANYIGLTAAFRDPDHAQWRQLLQIKPGKSIKLEVNLGAQNISVTQ